MPRASRRPFLQPDAAAAGFARRALVDELDPKAVERGDQLHQRLHIAADYAVARFHALDRGQRKPRGLGERPLIDAGERPGGPQLSRRDHGPALRKVILNGRYDGSYISNDGYCGRAHNRRMPYSIDGKLVVAISSRALYDCEEDIRAFDKDGEQAYIAVQYGRIDVPRRHDVAGPLGARLLAC